MPDDQPRTAHPPGTAEPAAPREVAATVVSPGECARRLAELFPALFSGAPKPLKLRVHVDIQARAPGVFGRPVLSAFMRRHTGSTAYLQAVARGTQRFGLDGEPAGEISAEHRQAALDELARRRARHAEQRERDDRERRERASLLRDYERTTLTEANFCALKGIAPAQLHAVLEQARREAALAPPPPLRPQRAGHEGGGERRHEAGRPGHEGSRPGQPHASDRGRPGERGPRRGGPPRQGRPPRG